MCSFLSLFVCVCVYVEMEKKKKKIESCLRWARLSSWVCWPYMRTHKYVVSWELKIEFIFCYSNFESLLFFFFLSFNTSSFLFTFRSHLLTSSYSSSSLHSMYIHITTNDMFALWVHLFFSLLKGFFLNFKL